MKTITRDQFIKGLATDFVEYTAIIDDYFVKAIGAMYDAHAEAFKDKHEFTREEVNALLSNMPSPEVMENMVAINAYLIRALSACFLVQVLLGKNQAECVGSFMVSYAMRIKTLHYPVFKALESEIKHAEESLEIQYAVYQTQNEEPPKEKKH